MNNKDLSVACELRYWYLATPYALYAGGKQEAYQEACRLSAILMSRKVVVFSPIVHNHPISYEPVTCDLMGDFHWWVETVDQAMMQGSCGLIVGMIDGWQESRGVAWEIEWYTSRDLPIVYWPVDQEIQLPAIQPRPAYIDSLSVLRSANIDRLPEFKNAKGEPAHSQPDGSDWSLAEWCNAVLGELGEAANIIKKIRRGDLSLDEARSALADELADTLIYLDILAYRAGIDLSQAAVSKWNRTSQRVGSRLRLAEGCSGYYRVKS